jgi:hypothetical protein
MRSGHKTESVYNRYNIGNDDDLKMTATKLEKYYDDQFSVKESSGRDPVQQEQTFMMLFSLMLSDALQGFKTSDGHNMGTIGHGG